MTNKYRTDVVEGGHIFAPSATEFSAPLLQKCRDIWADRATEFSAPQLQQSRDIYADSAKRIEL